MGSKLNHETMTINYIKMVTIHLKVLPIASLSLCLVGRKEIERVEEKRKEDK